MQSLGADVARTIEFGSPLAINLGDSIESLTAAIAIAIREPTDVVHDVATEALAS